MKIKQKRVCCHLTSVHGPHDIRIFIKECRSLTSIFDEVHFIVPNGVSTIVDGVIVHGITQSSNRLRRMTDTVEAVYEEALKIDADLYHFHDPELIPVGLRLKKKGKKVIYDVHEDVPRALLSKYWIPKVFRTPISKLFEIYENRAAKQFDFILAATPFIAQRFKKINPYTENVNNFPLLNELQTVDKGGNKKDSVVSFVGGLAPIRGAIQLIESADLINGSIYIAGPVTPKELTEKIKHHSKIQYLGKINREQVKTLLASSMAGLVTFLPEPNHINAQPNKMFEYMSAGIPVISSDFPLWRSIIEKHNCGLCVDPKNPEELARAINYIFEHPEIAEQMGHNGRKAVENEYNWEKEMEKLFKVYESLIPKENSLNEINTNEYTHA